ncbi:MAG: translocation/assembly module TamB domain-containing protein [Gemmatimonadaceae bacterium]|nr:translocation/assembly module TamB domain-containing protein [Gemmatimonadaceae bacterium]
MRRRLRVMLWVTLGLVGGAAVATAAFATFVLQTDRGRAWAARRIAEAAAAALVDGAVLQLHGLRLTPIGSVAVDSLSLTDPSGRRVVGIGAVSARVALAPLLDREVHIQRLLIADPTVELEQDAAGDWNVAALLRETPSTTPSTPTEGSQRQAWTFSVDSLELQNGTVGVTRPDSVPNAPSLRREYSGIALGLGASSFDVASGRAEFNVSSASLRADDPPLQLREAIGRVVVTPDSVGLAFPTLRVDGSQLALNGAIGLPKDGDDARLDLDLRAVRVDLADLAWASDLVPDSGSATGRIAIQNGTRRGTTRYRITDLVLRAGDSDLRGRLMADVTDATGALEIRDVDVVAAPLDLVLVRQLFGDSTPPPPFDGRLRGRLRARGGPLDRWLLDSATLTYEDRRIAGAESQFTVAGSLDLLATDTRLQPLTVRIDSMDVRTAGAVTDVADSLQGFLRGRVLLDGPVSNIAFRELDLVHVDAALPRSHVRGSGRLASDVSTTWLEARLSLDTVGVASLGRAFTPERLAGRLHGTLDVSATGDSVALDLALSGEDADVAFRGATSMDTARLVLKGEAAVWALDLRRFAPGLVLPPHALTARATLGLDGPWEEPSGPISFAIDSTSQLAGLSLADGRGDLLLEPGGIRVDTIAIRGPVGSFAARGRLSREPALRDTLRFVAVLDSAALLAGFLSDSLAEAWADSLGGSARLEGIALGSLDTLDVQAQLRATGLHAGSYAVRQVDAELLLGGLPTATRGLVTFDAVQIDGLGLPVHRLSAEATVREAAWADASLRMIAADTVVASARADVHYMGDSLELRLDSLEARTQNAAWRLRRPARVFAGPDRTVVDSLDLSSDDGAQLTLDAELRSAGEVYLRSVVTRVPLRHARFTGLMPPRVDGAVSLDATLTGSTAAPRLTMTGALDSTVVDGTVGPRFSFQAQFADQVAQVLMRGELQDRDAFAVTAELPLDLRLESRTIDQRLLEAPLYVRVTADGSPLAGVQAFAPGLRDLRGGYDADIQVTGTWRALEPRGILLVRDGAFAIPALGTGFREFDADVGFAPDSILVYRARLADERATNDTASVEGAVVRTAAGWRADLRSVARSLRLIDDPRVAEADVSWQLRMSGPLDSLAIGGVVTVPNANVSIGRQRRQVLQLAEDQEAEAASSVYAPYLEGLRVRLGNEVRLKSPEASVQLTGEVNVTGRLTEPSVIGEIQAERGTYRLDLGLLQRTFQVDSGRVRMNGPLTNSPTLDIHTSYVVRQADREDVHIGARLSGTVDQPRLALSSSDLGTTASETEIISYLLFGAPTFALDGQSASAVRLATAALVPSLGGAAERALGARLPFLSELQVVTVAGDSPQDFTLNSFEGLLNSFALTAGTQIGTDSYLRLSGGVCRGENRAAQSLPAWFGIAAEYRPRERLSAELSLTPGSAPCNRIGSFAQIYQLGFDLYRDWRW